MNYRKLTTALETLGWCCVETLHDGRDGFFFGVTVTFTGVKHFSLKLFEEKLNEVLNKGVAEDWLTEEERLCCYDVVFFDGGKVRALLVTRPVSELYEELKDALGVRGSSLDLSLPCLFDDRHYYDFNAEQLSTLFLMAALPSFYFPFETFDRIHNILRGDGFFEFQSKAKEEVTAIENALPYLPNARLMMAIVNVGNYVKTVQAGKLPAAMFENDFLHHSNVGDEVVSRELFTRGVPVTLAGVYKTASKQPYVPVWVTEVRVSGKYGDAEYAIEFDCVEDRWSDLRHGDKHAGIGCEFTALASFNYRIVPTFSDEGYINAIERIVGS